MYRYPFHFDAEVAKRLPDRSYSAEASEPPVFTVTFQTTEYGAELAAADAVQQFERSIRGFRVTPSNGRHWLLQLVTDDNLGQATFERAVSDIYKQNDWLGAKRFKRFWAHLMGLTPLRGTDWRMTVLADSGDQHPALIHELWLDCTPDNNDGRHQANVTILFHKAGGSEKVRVPLSLERFSSISTGHICIETGRAADLLGLGTVRQADLKPHVRRWCGINLEGAVRLGRVGRKPVLFFETYRDATHFISRWDGAR